MGGSQLALPLGSRKNRLLGRSGGDLGEPLGALGAVLGLSWGSHGALLGHLGAILRPRKAIEREEARKQASLIFFRCLKEFRFLGASPQISEASWSSLGAFLGPLGAFGEASCGILGCLEPC
eukprot:8862983-Pyramimonas_sp.AAC.1